MKSHRKSIKKCFKKSKRLHIESFWRYLFMRTESKPTIQDVAKHASVSIATVSRVINNQGGVRAETEKRIVHAIKELGYVRNAVARSMKKKETKMIGIIIPDINNPLFPLVVSGIEQQARKKAITRC